MTDPFPRRPLWTRALRSVRPTYGARRNAADGVADLRRSRSHRAQAAAAFSAVPGGVPDQRTPSGPGW